MSPDHGGEPTTVSAVIRWIVANPWAALGRRWNYKSAILSSLVRALIFFAANVGEGREAAQAAMLTELAFRFTTAGFYGALTQAFRRVEPRSSGTLAAMVVLPLVAHSLEYLVHWWRGTPALATSLALSVAFTALSTTFNLFAMRHGAFVVGQGRRSLSSDLMALPRLIVLFLGAAARGCRRGWA